MVTSSENNSLSPMPALDHLNIRRARPEDVDTIASFSAAMAQETEGRRLDLDRLHLGTIALMFAFLPLVHAEETVGDKAHEVKQDAVHAKR